MQGTDEAMDRFRENINDIYSKLEDMKDDIYDIKKENAETKVEIRVLCRDMQNLTNAIKWGCAVLITCFGGFFIWAVQQNMFR